jgi:hypothetical protein
VNRSHRVRSRLTGVGLATAALVGGLASTPSSPASAAPRTATYAPAAVLVSKTSSQVTVIVGGLRKDLQLQPTPQVLAGNFGTGQDGAFLYNPGTGKDGVLRFHVANGKIITSFTPTPVSGRYRPIVIDLDRDGLSEIYWYGPGTAKDFIWSFAQDGSHTSIAATPDVAGDATPVPISGHINTDWMDYSVGILFYEPGKSHTELWHYSLTPSGGTTVPISGRYRPIVGEFLWDDLESGPDILWYSQTGPEYVWTFSHNADSYRSTRVGDIGPGARPTLGAYGVQGDNPYGGFGAGSVIFWYVPGSPTEKYWIPQLGNYKQQIKVQPAGSITGDYRPMAYGPNDILLLGSGTTAKLMHLTASGPSGTISLSGLPTAAFGAGFGAIRTS